MKTKEDYEAAFLIIKESMRRIDPYSLIEGGCPEDEFDPEIQKIVAAVQNWKSGGDVAKTMASVLSPQFNEKFEENEFESEGQVIYEKLESAKLL